MIKIVIIKRRQNYKECYNFWWAHARGVTWANSVTLDLWMWNKMSLFIGEFWYTRFCWEVGCFWFLKTKQELGKWLNDVVLKFWSWEGKCYWSFSWVVLVHPGWVLLTVWPKRKGKYSISIIRKKNKKNRVTRSNIRYLKSNFDI